MPARCGIPRLSKSGNPLPERERTLPEILGAHGATSALFGKWHLGMLRGAPIHFPTTHGFATWFATYNNTDHVDPTDYLTSDGAVGKLAGYDSRLIVDRALAWLDQRQQGADAARPFYLYLAFHTPHEPLGAPADDVAHYADITDEQTRAYSADVAASDAAVGAFLDGLDRLGLARDTVVFLSSDNGPEHRTAPWGSTGGLRGAKLSLYEGGIRVPGIVRWPGRIPAGTVSDVPFGFVDWLPTVCARFGIASGNNPVRDGTDAYAAWLDQDVARAQPLAWWFSAAEKSPQAAVIDGAWKLIATPDPRGGPTLKDVALYDLAADRAETTDRAVAEPERLQRMQASLAAILASVRAEPKPPAVPKDDAPAPAGE